MRVLKSKNIIYLFLIVLLAAVLRTVRMFEESWFGPDVYVYFYMAKNWAYHGVAYAYFNGFKQIPPLLLWIMGNGYRIGLEPDQTGLILGVILGSLMPLAAFWIVNNLFESADVCDSGRLCEYALLAAFITAVHPFFIRISVSCLREIIYLPTTAFAVGFAISAIKKKSLWRWGIFALLAALGSMSRREGVEVIIIFLVWGGIELFIDRKNLRKIIFHYLLTALLVISIYGFLVLSVMYSLRDTACTWNPLIVDCFHLKN
jgi:hypothetical protein